MVHDRSGKLRFIADLEFSGRLLAWPEKAAVYIFSCSKKLDHDAIHDELKRALSARKVPQKSFRRGFAYKKPTRQ